MNQLILMGITDLKDQQKYTVMGTVMASMALLIKVHKKIFPGTAYLLQIDDLSYKICKVFTDIINPLDEKGEYYVKGSSKRWEQ